jgi:hypothetical protein
MFAVASRRHWRISIAVALGLLAIGRFSYLWYAWGGLLLVLTLRFRHPPLADEWKPLDPSRRVWALIALTIFALCFTPWAAVIGSR